MDAASRLTRQQAAIAELGQRALQPADLATVMQQVVEVVAATVRVEHASILELSPDGGEVRLRAGIGWEQDHIGHRARAEVGGHVAYVLGAPSPVVVHDLPRERRFAPSTLLVAQGVRSSLAVRIPGAGGQARAFGVLGMHSTELRTFADDEIEFASTMATMLAAAIRRHRQAVELNDTIVQALVVARYELARGGTERAAELLDEALERARALVDGLLGSEPGGAGSPLPGDLRRGAAADIA